MSKNLVSVIITTLDAEKYIGRALNSIVEQNYISIEIIVVDAGSKDSTKEICANYNLVKFYNLKDSSMGEARNYGIKKSKGEYIMFLDADDFYLKNKINFQVNKLKENKSLDFLVNTAYLINNKKDDRIGTKTFTLGKLNLEDFLEGKCYSLGALCLRKEALYRKSILFYEGEKGYFGEDWSFQLRLCYEGLNYEFFKNQLLIIELRNDSFVKWEDEYKRKESALSIIEKFFSNNNSLILEQKLQNIINKYLFKLAISYFINGMYLEGYKTLKRQSNKNNKKNICLKIASYLLPRNLFAYLLKVIWKLSQNKSFTWESPNKDLREWIRINNLFLK